MFVAPKDPNVTNTTRKRWQVLVLAVVTAMLTVRIFNDRGAGWAVLAVVTYGTLVLAALFHEYYSRLLKKHPLLDASFFCPILIMALGLFTEWSFLNCVLIAITPTALLVAMVALGRRRSRSRT